MINTLFFIAASGLDKGRSLISYGGEYHGLRSTSSGSSRGEQHLSPHSMRMQPQHKHQQVRGRPRDDGSETGGGSGSDDDSGEELDQLLKQLRQRNRQAERSQDDAQHASEEAGSGGSHARRLGDDWYVEHRVKCACCQQPVRSSRGRRGVCCMGCSRWYHDQCVPQGMLNAAGTPPAGGAGFRAFYCTDACRTVRGRILALVAAYDDAPLAAATAAGPAAAAGSWQPRWPWGSSSSTAAAAAATTGSSGSSHAGGTTAADGKASTTPRLTVTLVDLLAAREAGGSAAAKAAESRGSQKHHSDNGFNAANTDAGKGGTPDKRSKQKKSLEAVKLNSRYQRLGLLPGGGGGSGSGNAADTGAAGSGDNPGAAAGSPVPAQAHRVQQPSGDSVAVLALKPRWTAVRSIVRIFNTDPVRIALGEPLEMDDLLEGDNYALLLKHNRLPVCALSFNVYGTDHARVQELVTINGYRRRGHATALVRELEVLLGRAGVPRLAALHAPGGGSGKDGADDDEDERITLGLFRQKLGFQELQDLSVLASWKKWFSSYHRDLLAPGARVLIKDVRPQPLISPVAVDSSEGTAPAAGKQ